MADNDKCPQCGAAETTREYNYGWFVTYSCGSTHFYDTSGRPLSGGNYPSQSSACVVAERNALRAEVARLQARVAALEDALRVSHEFLVKFERAGDRIICSAEGDECPAWWNEHFDALHGRVECWTASAQLHAAIDAARKEATRG